MPRYYGDLLQEIFLRNRVRCRDGACAGVDLSEKDRIPGRPYHHLPAEKLNRVQPKSLLYQLSYVGAAAELKKRVIRILRLFEAGPLRFHSK